MKNIIAIITAAILSIVCFGQEAHLKFKGISIEGNYKAFAQKLIQKGFTQIESSEDGIILSGNFMATPNVMVLVYPDPTTKAVSAVSAMIEAGNNWPSIEGQYYKVVDTYKEKYGAPKEHFESFTSSPSSDWDKKHALYEGQCNYKSQWSVEGGRIIISLVYFQLNNYVVCAYVDEQNEKALRKTIIDDI